MIPSWKTEVSEYLLLFCTAFLDLANSNCQHDTMNKKLPHHHVLMESTCFSSCCLADQMLGQTFASDQSCQPMLNTQKAD